MMLQPYTVHPRRQTMGYTNDITDEIHANISNPIASLLHYTSTQYTQGMPFRLYSRE